MKGNVEKNFFYRKRRNTAEKKFVHDNDAMKKEIVRVIEKNKYIEQTVFFSPKDKRWKSINEFSSEHDWHNTLELEYTEDCCYPHLPQSILKDKAADFIEDYTAEQMRDYLQYRRDLARTEYFNKIAYDADKIPKNLFAFEITSDTENLFVEIKARFFIAVPYPVETNTCDLGEESASILYDIKNGKIEKIAELLAWMMTKAYYCVAYGKENVNFRFDENGNITLNGLENPELAYTKEKAAPYMQLRNLVFCNSDAELLTRYKTWTSKNGKKISPFIILKDMQSRPWTATIGAEKLPPPPPNLKKMYEEDIVDFVIGKKSLNRQNWEDWLSEFDRKGGTDWEKECFKFAKEHNLLTK